MFDIENIIAYIRNLLLITYVFKNIYKQIYMYKTIEYNVFKDHTLNVCVLIEIYYVFIHVYSCNKFLYRDPGSILGRGNIFRDKFIYRFSTH